MRRGKYQEPTQKRSNPLTANYYPVAPNEEFLHVHMPGAWQFVEHDGKLTWLPILQQFRLMRGANGIRGDKDHRDPSFFVAQFQRKGGTVVAPDDPRLGEEYRDYVYTIECVDKSGAIGKYHLTQFETPIVMGGQTRFEVDNAAWRAFLQHCVDVGIVEPMSVVALELKVEQQERRVRNQKRRAGDNKHLEDALKEAESVLVQMRQRWEEQFGVPVAREMPKPKNKGSK